MDPNETLKQINYELGLVSTFYPIDPNIADDAGERLDLLCQDLFDWLDRGGFQPDWTAYPTAASYYECRAVHHKRGERV